MSKVTKENYPTIKSMIVANIPRKDIARTLNISTTTVSRVERSTDFDSYKFITTVQSRRGVKKAEKVVEATPPAPANNNDMLVVTGIHELTKSVNELTEVLKDALDKLDNSPLKEEARGYRLFGKINR